MNSKKGFRFSAKQLLEVARKPYNRVPVRLRWIASPLIYFHRFCRLLPKLRFKLWILSGDERVSQMPLSILYAANVRNPASIKIMNYLLGLSFGDSFQKRYLGRSWLWKIHRVMAERRQDCSLMVVQVDKSLRKFMRAKDLFFIPWGVFGEVEIPGDLTVTKNSSLKSDFRRIRKHSLGFEVTRNLQQFDDFYHNMYLPQITMAHGNSANIVPYEDMRSKFQNCDLLLVKKQDRRIAGILIVYEETGPRLWVLGIREANRKYIKHGAIGALYHFSFLYLKEKGFTKVKLGQSRAFLRDGVLQYKRKWSQKIVDATSYVDALKVLSYTDGTKAFLQQNPFIFENGGTLNGAIFMDGEKALTTEDIEEIDKQFSHAGLSKLYIYCFHNSEEINQNSIPPELSERIVLRSAGDIA